MKTIEPMSFALVCFLALMQNGDGLIDKAPDYITEKTRILGSGLDAFAALDIHNMRKVVGWCHAWGITVPEPIAKEMELQEQAFEELQAKGWTL